MCYYYFISKRVYQSYQSSSMYDIRQEPRRNDMLDFGFWILGFLGGFRMAEKK